MTDTNEHAFSLDILHDCFEAAAAPDSASADPLRARTSVPADVIRTCATYGLPRCDGYDFSPHFVENDTWTIEVNRLGAYQDSYHIDWLKRRVLPGSMESEVRGRAFGRQMFANRALVGLVLGFTDMTLEAAGYMGGYVWPRAGVLAQASAVHALKESLRLRADILRPWLYRREWEQLDRCCMLRTKTDVWTIAAMDRVLPISRETFDESRKDYAAKILSNYEERGFFHEGAISISQFLLAGLHYDAYVRFSDAVQMDRLEAYCHTPVRALARQMLAAIPPTQCAECSSNPPSRTGPLP